MGEDGKVVYKIEGDNSQAMKAIDEFEKEAKKTGDQFEDTVEDTMDGAEGTVSDAAAKIAKAIGSAFVVKQVVEFGKAAVGVASDLNEVQNVVDTTFGTAGAIKINEWARNAAEAFGESELQAKQFTSTLGAMFKSMGVGQADMEEMSMSLAGLAGDMASFYNLDPTEAFEKLRSGISGETEPLKQLGINMSVVNLEAFAMSEGITKSYQEMTQAEQATLRYQYIMSATADAQGDFSNTSDSLANQQRILQLEIQTLAAEIGNDLMPIAQGAIEIARNGVEWVTEHKDALEKLTVAVGAAATGYAAWKAIIKAEELYDSTVNGIKGIATAMKGAEAATGLMSTAMSAIPYVAIVAGIAAITAAVIELKEAQEEALQSQYEYMDSFVSLADYRANGLVDASGRVDYKKAEQMQANGTFKRDDTVLKAAPGRNFYSIKELASRHQSGEDFVMADWTPAYLDYGERVLTAAENAKYTAMGGVDGMERQIAYRGMNSELNTRYPAAPSKTIVNIEFRGSLAQLGRVLQPVITTETARQGPDLLKG